MQRKKDKETEDLKKAVVEGILKKQGKEITILDLQNIDTAVCQYFILCHGDSNIQVEAIAASIEDEVKEKRNEKVLHREGLKLSQWVLLDYGDIIVHIFQKEYRDFYRLESLWADAVREDIEEELNLKS